MESERLCDSLFTWLRTFPAVSSVHTYSEITDGVIMAKVLHQIDPKYFDDTWNSKIKTDANNNWRLKVSNLKKILKGILDYYADVLGQHIHDFQMPDVNAIGERNDASELGRLLQLILGCAVNCGRKQEYIEVIMGMEESVQHVVMNAIQELMTKETPATNEIGDQLKRVEDELHSALQAKEEFAQRCHELDLQVAALQEEKIHYQEDNQKLMERINMNDVADDMTSSTSSSRKVQQLQFQCDKQVDEIYRMEAARDDYRAKVDVQDKEMEELKLRIDELTILAEEARILKDEVDVLKHSSDKAAKYESTIETYKKKLDDMNDLKRQMKLIEEKNEIYMTQNMELEEDIRKGGALKSQIDMYKRQVQELQNKVTDETKRADKAEFAITRAEAKITALEREKETLVLERDSLRETNEELTLSKMHDGPNDPSAGDFSGSPNLEMMALPPEIREKLIRLQHENKMLKLNAPKESDDHTLLQTMLDDSNSRKNELESELRIANQRIIEIEAQVEDLRDKQLASANEDHSDLRRRVNELQRKIKDFESAEEQSKCKIEQLESRLEEKHDQFSRIQDSLTRKTDDMKNMEEKYKKYFEKAKCVIRQLDPKLNPGSGPELMALKNQLQEKEKLIQHLEHDHERYKTVREQEEKLVVSAWYNMSVQMQRKASEERLSNSSSGQSFLARQRQAHNKRLQNIPGAHQTSSSDFLEY